MKQFVKDKITLLHCDCMQYMKDIPDNYFDLAIVDPPYGIGMGGSLNVNSNVKFINKVWDTEIPKDSYFKELQRVSKNQIIWGGNYFPYIWQKPCRGFICWNKMNHHDNRADIEMAWTSIDGLAKYVEYMWDGNRYGTKNNIKGVGKPTIRIHPTEKPQYLYKWLLKNYATPDMKIIDTHLGSGSSAIAAHDFGCEFVGMEIDEEYYDSAVKRFDMETRQLTIF